MIAHTEAGPPKAPTLVFLHGGGLSARQWRPQFQALSDDFHLLAPDLPEQGRSLSLSPFTLEGAAAELAALIEAKASGRKAHLIGLSLGGAVGLELLRSRPELVSSLFVSGTAAGLGRVLGGISLASAGLYGVLPRRWLTDLALRQFGVPTEYAEAFREDLTRSATPAFTRHFTRALMAMRLPEAGAVPVLVAVGEKETFAARQAARTLTSRLSGARHVLVPGRGHVWNLEDAALFTATVRAWVTESPLPEALR